MADIIATRREHKITENGTVIEFRIFIWSVNEIAPIEPQYTVIKTSPDKTVAVDLDLNISPFVEDYFVYGVPDTTPVDVEDLQVYGTYMLNVRVDTTNLVNGTTATYEFDAYDGYVKVRKGSLLIHRGTVKNIGLDEEYSFMVAEGTGVTHVRWLTSAGDDIVVENLHGDRLLVFPVIHPLIDQNNDVKWVQIELQGDASVDTRPYRMNVVCTYHDPNSIGFINWYGVIEFITGTGTLTESFVSRGSRYTRYSDEVSAQLNRNVLISERFSTGWVDNGFRQVIQDMMASNKTFLYTSSPFDYDIILTSNSIRRPDSRVDKMLNYVLTWDRAINLIQK